MSDEKNTPEPDEAKIDDPIVVHDEHKAIEEAKASHENAPKAEPDAELAKKTNTEGVGVAEMQSSRERHQYMQ